MLEVRLKPGSTAKKPVSKTAFQKENKRNNQQQYTYTKAAPYVLCDVCLD